MTGNNVAIMWYVMSYVPAGNDKLAKIFNIYSADNICTILSV